MNLKWKRLAVLGLATVLVASACGGRDDDSGSGDDNGGDDNGETAEGAFIDPSVDCPSYDGTAGIDGDTIKIGTIRPADGPFAIYDQVTTGLEAYVESVNSNGGIEAGDGNTYMLELVKENDGYDPGRTPPLAQKLVEQDGVFALVGVIGTENNLAIRDYMNDACVPNISLATGSTEWGKADQYPWYISALPSYALEASYWVDHLAETNPEAQIALLFQDDDFGQAYQAALEKSIEASNSENGTSMAVIAEQGYSPLSGTTTEAATVQLSQSGADTFIVGISGTPCPQTLTFVPETWTPTTYISVTCAGNTALSIAGPRAAGVFAIQPTYDPADPADADVEAVQTFRSEAAAAGLDEGQIDGGITSVGWGFGALFVRGLEAAETVDRAGVMNALMDLDDEAFGLIREGIEIKTDGANDPWAVEGARMVQRNADSTGWDEQSPIVNKNGESNQLAG